MSNSDDWGLELCPICNQMTNHDDDGCLKCRHRSTLSNANDSALHCTIASTFPFNTFTGETLRQLVEATEGLIAKETVAMAARAAAQIANLEQKITVLEVGRSNHERR